MPQGRLRCAAGTQLLPTAPTTPKLNAQACLKGLLPSFLNWRRWDAAVPCHAGWARGVSADWGQTSPWCHLPPCSKQGTEHTGTDAVRWTLQSCIEPPKGNRDGENLCQKVPKAVPCCRNDAEQAAFWLLLDRVGFGGVPLLGNKLCSRFWCLPDSLCPWAGLELCRWVSWGSPGPASCPGSSPPSPSPLSFPPTVTSEQIEHLHRRFKQLSRDQLTIRKENFDSIPDLEFNPIRGKIVHAFFDKRNLRQESDGLADEINFEDFLTIMSYFRPIEMNMDEEQLDRFRKEKLKFLFHMYDSDHDGKITLQEYRNVVEELLSGNPHLEKESARSIADGAMMEAASICVGQMGPDQVYEGITFEDFLKMWQGIDIETKMHVRFLNMETIAHCY